MYLTIFGETKVIKIQNEAFIIGIKRMMGPMFNIPVTRINLTYIDKKLDDYDLISSVVERLEKFKVYDIKAFDEDRFLCKMECEEDPEDTMDMILRCVTSVVDASVFISVNTRYEKERPPYAKVLPDQRQNAMVIQMDSSTEKIDQDGIVRFFEDKLLESKKPLKFDAIAQLMPLDDKGLLIMGDSADTRDWMLRVSQDICPPYRCEPFVKFFELERWCFIMPVMTQSDLCSCFQIFEKQNSPLDTSKWCVVDQKVLEVATENRICELYPDMKLTVFIDKKSREQMANNDFKLKYVLWKLKLCLCEDCRRNRHHIHELIG